MLGACVQHAHQLGIMVCDTVYEYVMHMCVSAPLKLSCSLLFSWCDFIEFPIGSATDTMLSKLFSKGNIYDYYRNLGFHRDRNETLKLFSHTDYKKYMENVSGIFSFGSFTLPMISAARKLANDISTDCVELPGLCFIPLCIHFFVMNIDLHLKLPVSNS